MLVEQTFFRRVVEVDGCSYVKQGLEDSDPADAVNKPDDGLGELLALRYISVRSQGRQA